ncbi:hypothetical protein [Nodularia sphaerocarpa]|nr:hypothetical protein [Nodularia sphaerocarpa]MDB9375585.1 hypothetical protein [Nodularia sphaerocarpa CS-585]ULP72165.1 hypothetical protein BDGGKGIB_01803 [Nodularia sphaerocarpa UHCC 0038]
MVFGQKVTLSNLETKMESYFFNYELELLKASGYATPAIRMAAR